MRKSIKVDTNCKIDIDTKEIDGRFKIRLNIKGNCGNLSDSKDFRRMIK